MRKFYRITAFILIIMAMMTLFGCDTGKGGEGGSTPGPVETVEGINFREYFSNLNLEAGSEIYYIEGESLSIEERILFSSLQGIIAKTKSELFIKYSGATTTWFKSLKEDFGITFTKIRKPYELLEMYKDRIKDSGYVTYESVTQENYKTEDRKKSESVNNACTIAGQENYLVVGSTIEEKVKEYGFEKKDDGMNYTSYELFEKYKENLNKGFLMHQKFSNFQIRDFGIAMGALFFYSYSDETLAELNQVHDWLNPMAVIMGWYEDEVGGVKLSSTKGNITVPSDYATNFTVYAALQVSDDEPLKQKDYQERFAGKDKHYVAFMLTDGDNITYHLNDVYETKGLDTRTERTVPVSWTFIPMAYDLAPHLAKYYYRIMGENDNFIASLSGVGYINPGYWPEEYLDKFAATTADYMGKMDEEVVAMLIDGASKEDLLEGTNPEVNSLQEISDALSKYDSIKGGFFYFGGEYVPDKDTAGTVTWSNGKPFINLRGGTWFAGNDVDRDEELAKLAYKINNRTKNAEVIEGYSVMVISAGTENAYENDLMTLTRMFDEDVVVVTCEELVKIMTENVKDKETSYVMHDEDYTAFHYSAGINKEDYEKLRYDYMSRRVLKQDVSDVTSYKFSEDKGGWMSAVVSDHKDTAIAEFADSQYHTLSSGEVRSDYLPDSYLYNKIRLPDEDGLKLSITGKFENADVRIKVIANDRIYTVYDYTTQNSGGEYKTIEVDISKFKGCEASIIYEVRNGESYISAIEI